MKDKGIRHSQQQCMDLIEKGLLKLLDNPEESHYCNCSICMNKYQLKQKGKHFLRQASSLLKLDSTKMRNFLMKLERVSELIYFKLQIPEIVFFEKGQPKYFFKSKNNGVHLTILPPGSAKNIASLFVDRKRPVTVTVLAEGIENTSENKQHHIKHMGQVIPSFRHDNSQDWSKPRSFIFHDNDLLDNTQKISLSRGTFEEVCIVKYIDKGFELLNQKQLRQLLKLPTNVKSIDFIQSYIKAKQKQQSFFFADYSSYQTIANSFMYKRALVHVKSQINLLTKISKDYVPVQTLEDYQSTLRDFPKDFCLYQSYKIIHYIEIVRDVKVTKLDTVWIKDENKQIYFFGLLGFDYDQIEEANNEIDIEEIKSVTDNKLLDLERELLQAWEKMKKRKKHFEDPPPKLDQKTQSQLDLLKSQSMVRKRKMSMSKQAKQSS